MSMSAPKAVKGRMIKAAFEELVGRVGGQVPAEASCRVSQSTIQRYCSTLDEHAALFPPADVIRDLEAVAGEPIVTSMLAGLAGYTIVREPNVAAPSKDVFAALADLSREMSDITTAVCTGFNDGKFCDVDAARTIREVNDVIERAAQMRALLQSIAGDRA
jgi:hypothetical protein